MRKFIRHIPLPVRLLLFRRNLVSPAFDHYALDKREARRVLTESKPFPYKTIPVFVLATVAVCLLADGFR